MVGTTCKFTFDELDPKFFRVTTVDNSLHCVPALRDVKDILPPVVDIFTDFYSGLPSSACFELDSLRAKAEALRVKVSDNLRSSVFKKHCIEFTPLHFDKTHLMVPSSLKLHEIFYRYSGAEIGSSILDLNSSPGIYGDLLQYTNPKLMCGIYNVKKSACKGPIDSDLYNTVNFSTNGDLSDIRTVLKMICNINRKRYSFDTFILDQKYKNIDEVSATLTNTITLVAQTSTLGANFVFNFDLQWYELFPIISALYMLFSEVIYTKPSSTSTLTTDFYVLCLTRKPFDANSPRPTFSDLNVHPDACKPSLDHFALYLYDEYISNTECLIEGGTYHRNRHCALITQTFIQNYLPRFEEIEDDTSDYGTADDNVSIPPPIETSTRAPHDTMEDFHEFLQSFNILPRNHVGLECIISDSSIRVDFRITMCEFDILSDIAQISVHTPFYIDSSAKNVYINTSKTSFGHILVTMLHAISNYLGFSIAVVIKDKPRAIEITQDAISPDFPQKMYMYVVCDDPDFVRIFVNKSDNISSNIYKHTIDEYMSYLQTLITTNIAEHTKVYNTYIANETFKSNSMLFGQQKDSKYKFGIIRRTDCEKGYTELQVGHRVDDNTRMVKCFYIDSFVDIVTVPLGKFALTSETSRMYYDTLHYAAFAKHYQEITSLSKVIITLEQGVGGNGKTHEITNVFNRDVNASSVLLLAPTQQAISNLKARVQSVAPKNEFKVKNFLTVNSFIVKDSLDAYERVFIDEALMLHPALVLLIAAKSKAVGVHCYGDMVQANFHSNVSFDFSYHLFRIYKISAPRWLSYRCTADALYAVQPWYDEVYELNGLPKTINVSNTGLINTLSFEDVNGPEEIPLDPKAIYLGFSEEDRKALSLRFPNHPEIHTVKSFQGRDTDHVIVYRHSSHSASVVHNSLHLMVSAFTRHKKTLRYYTRCHENKDLFRARIFAANHASPEAIKIHTLSRVNTGTYIINTEKPVGCRYTPEHIRYTSTKSSTHIPLLPSLHARAIANIASTSSSEVSISSHTLRKLDISVINLNRIIGKFAPSVKKINVLVSQNTNSHSEHLISQSQDAMVAQGTPFVLDDIFVELDLPTKPPLHVPRLPTVAQPSGFYQNYINRQFPGYLGVDTKYDSYHIQQYINVHIPNAKMDSSPLLCTEVEIPTLAPIIITPCPRLRPNNFYEVTHTLSLRNMNPPELLLNNCTEYSAKQLLHSFINAYITPEGNHALSTMSSIGPTLTSIVNWLHKQDSSVADKIVPELPYLRDKFNHYEVIIKRNPKIKLDADCFDNFPALQSIIHCDKKFNAIMCPIIDKLKNRLKACLPNHVLLFCDVSPEQFAANIDSVCPPTMVTYGEPTLEIDASQFDQSQGLTVLEFECLLMRFFGVREFYITMWYASHYYKIVRDRKHRNTFILPQQRTSGDGGTWFFNTTYLMSVIAYQYNISTVKFALFSGDDSLIVGRFSPRHNVSFFAEKFNLQIKLFNFSKSFYFCSKFLIKSPYGWIFLPDPLKILVKLGSHNIRNFEHLELIRISLEDLTRDYDRVDLSCVIDKCMHDRYPANTNYSKLVLALHGLIRDKPAFTCMFYVPVGVELLQDPSIPNLD